MVIKELLTNNIDIIRLSCNLYINEHFLKIQEGIDGEVLLAKSETDIAVASITAAGIVPGVVTIGNQQITVEGATVGTSADGHFSGVVSVDGQVAANAQYHVNQLNEELLRGGEISNNLKSAVQVNESS